jgi:hypothetical protein
MNCVTVQEVVLAMTLMGVASGYFGFIIGRYLRASGTSEKSAETGSPAV